MHILRTYIFNPPTTSSNLGLDVHRKVARQPKPETRTEQGEAEEKEDSDFRGPGPFDSLCNRVWRALGLEV